LHAASREYIHPAKGEEFDAVTRISEMRIRPEASIQAEHQATRQGDMHALPLSPRTKEALKIRTSAGPSWDLLDKNGGSDPPFFHARGRSVAVGLVVTIRDPTMSGATPRALRSPDFFSEVEAFTTESDWAGRE
jgi:hypothetical protein